MKMGLQIWFFTISKFEMSGKYGFIRTFSGSGVLFRVASGKTVAKIINKIDLDIAIPGRDKKVDYALVYSGIQEKSGILTVAIISLTR